MSKQQRTNVFNRAWSAVKGLGSGTRAAPRYESQVRYQSQDSLLTATGLAQSPVTSEGLTPLGSDDLVRPSNPTKVLESTARNIERELDDTRQRPARYHRYDRPEPASDACLDVLPGHNDRPRKAASEQGFSADAYQAEVFHTSQKGRDRHSFAGIRGDDVMDQEALHQTRPSHREQDHILDGQPGPGRSVIGYHPDNEEMRGSRQDMRTSGHLIVPVHSQAAMAPVVEYPRTTPYHINVIPGSQGQHHAPPPYPMDNMSHRVPVSHTMPAYVQQSALTYMSQYAPAPHIQTGQAGYLHPHLQHFVARAEPIVSQPNHGARRGSASSDNSYDTEASRCSRTIPSRQPCKVMDDREVRRSGVSRTERKPKYSSYCSRRQTSGMSSDSSRASDRASQALPRKSSRWQQAHSPVESRNRRRQYDADTKEGVVRAYQGQYQTARERSASSECDRLYGRNKDSPRSRASRKYSSGIRSSHVVRQRSESDSDEGRDSPQWNSLSRGSPRRLREPSGSSGDDTRRVSFRRRAGRRRSHSESDARAPKYNGKFDFSDFKVQFECIAEDARWSYVTRGKKLSRCLTDDARSVLGSLDVEVRRDYDTLCGALLALHTTPGGEGVRQNELHHTTRTNGQCPSKFGLELKKLAKRAYPLGNMSEPVLVRIFIKGLNCQALEAHVGLQEPKTLAEAIKLACSYEAYYGSTETAARKPKNVCVAQSTQDSSMSSKLAELLTRFERLEAKLEKPRASGPPNAESECFYCHGRGHFANSCPQRNPRPQQSYKEYRQAANAAQVEASSPQGEYVFPEMTNSLNG